MISVVPYLNFNGNCREAFEFYHSVLGGEAPELITHNEMPMDDLPEEMKDLVLHARLSFEGGQLMGSDALANDFTESQGMFVSLQMDDHEAARRLYNRLSEGGTLIMPIDQQPWEALFALFSDRFGTPWMINSEPS